MTYNPAIHHRRSIRLKGYDYSQAGLYFVTICCQDRLCRFGKIENDEMILNEYGEIAYNEWMNTPNVRTNITLDVFVVMPNHIHGIIIINEFRPDERRDVSHTSLLPEGGLLMGEFDSPQRLNDTHRPFRSPSQTIGAVIRGYKSAVTKKISEMGFSGTIWQRNYYEHIIRNEQAYHNISNYIINNPMNWDKDSLK